MIKYDELFCKIRTEYFNYSFRLLQENTGNLIISRVYILVTVAAAAAAATTASAAAAILLTLQLQLQLTLHTLRKY